MLEAISRIPKGILISDFEDMYLLEDTHRKTSRLIWGMNGKPTTARL